MNATKESADALVVSVGKEKISRTLTVKGQEGDTVEITLILYADGYVSDQFWAVVQDKFMELQSEAEDIFKS